jgi:YidC/Oxa1 family membrane protein insertase
MQNSRNFYITIALSVLILTLWQVFYMNPRIEQQREVQRVEMERLEKEKAAQTPAATPGAAAPGTTTPAAPGTVADASTAANASLTREAALAQTQRVAIETPALAGSINLTGARFDDIVLKNFREEVSNSSPPIKLLSPAPLPSGYFAELGYSGNETTGKVPGPDTVWTVDGNATLTPTTPVTLTYTNDKNITFKRTIAVDPEYMFTVSDSVSNGGATPVSLSPYGRVTRYERPAGAAIFVLFEGLIGVAGDEGLQEITYDNAIEDKEVKPAKSNDGWLGITDKYWATALVPSAKQPFQMRFSHFEEGRARFQSDFLSDPVSIAPGASETVEHLLFAGAKEVGKIDAYESERGIRQFELMIDWGWFYFLTKPMFKLMDWLFRLFGNFGLAILATTVIVKLIFFPLANKSYVSMAHMKTAQPKMMEIKEKYANDRAKQQQAMMELYKTEKINPIAGCWPVLLQIPVFFALYKVIYVTIEMRHAPFYGWIKDLSAPDPTSIFNLFGLLPFDVPGFLLIGVWPLLMGITMFLQMRMNPAPPDPTQAAIFNWMPVIFTFMMATFPAGLIIYWAWNNFLSILQQGYIMKKNGAKIELWDNLVGMFKKKPKAA